MDDAEKRAEIARLQAELAQTTGGTDAPPASHQPGSRRARYVAIGGALFAAALVAVLVFVFTRGPDVAGSDEVDLGAWRTDLVAVGANPSSMAFILEQTQDACAMDAATFKQYASIIADAGGNLATVQVSTAYVCPDRLDELNALIASFD